MSSWTPRSHAKSVVRGELRHQGTEPEDATIEQIVKTLDELARGVGPIRHYYLNASDRAIKTFAREIQRGVY